MEIKKTITSIFIVPTLNIGKEKLVDNGFINGYIRDKRSEFDYEDCIYLLFKPKDLDKFKDFLDGEYERTKQIIHDYDYEDGFVVIVYTIDGSLRKDIELVKRSKYSKTSKEFQKLFPKVVKLKKNGLYKDEISLQYRIFNKTQDLIEFWEEKLGIEFDDDLEVWHAFIEENEILDLDKIKEHV